MPSPGSAPTAGTAPTPRGPWSETPADAFDGLDLGSVRWLDADDYEQMTNDPAWLEATAARADARSDTADADEGDDAEQGCDAQLLALEAAAGLGLTRHAEDQLTAAAELAARQRATLEVTLVTIVSELVSRGVTLPGGLSHPDWLRSHDPSLTAGQAKAFVTVGTAITQARWARLRLLVATQQVTVGNAAQIIDFDTRTRPVADPDDLTTALTDLTEQAPRLRPEELARLVRHHTEQVRPPRDRGCPRQGAARGPWALVLPTHRRPAWSGSAAPSTPKAPRSSKQPSTPSQPPHPSPTSRAAPSPPTSEPPPADAWTPSSPSPNAPSPPPTASPRPTRPRSSSSSTSTPSRTTSGRTTPGRGAAPPATRSHRKDPHR